MSSLPPHLIRVKRKRDDEAPVTFLQFDDGVKRQRAGNNWAYQRRTAGPQSPSDASGKYSRDAQPVIHVSGPDDQGGRSPAATKANRPSTTKDGPTAKSEPRRFHISRKTMLSAAAEAQSSTSGVSKKARYGPAVFVERGRAKAAQRTTRQLDRARSPAPVDAAFSEKDVDTMAVDATGGERRLKRPGVKSRSRSPQPDAATGRAPLPASAMNPHTADMSKITADMNDWVMKEIGANLESMEQEKQRERSRFKPKAPALRYQERHPEAAAPAQRDADIDMDLAMRDGSDGEDEGDWVIEEYVRIPVHAMAVDVSPADVGVLVLDGQDDNTLFFGPDRDEDEDLDEDDEDENGENYYTADYPEDEVESDDEYGRHAYGYRNGNASDDEEFDNDLFEESDGDDMVVEGGDDGDDATMARIKAYMRRNRAFHQ